MQHFIPSPWLLGKMIDKAMVACDASVEQATLQCAATTARGVAEHVWHASGAAKTVCTSHVLAAFGIDASTYKYSGYAHQRAGVLRRNGYAVRSRMSKLGKRRTVGAARAAIRALAGHDPVGTRYMVCVAVGDQRHCLLLAADGTTIVDTDPRDADRRRVTAVHAVFRA
jgi:hypothetical protein